jgi:hypothetical protein
MVDRIIYAKEEEKLGKPVSAEEFWTRHNAGQRDLQD